MNYTDIQARLDIIRNLPIAHLDQRQPLLVALLADLVNNETNNGDCTTSSNGLEYQDYWTTLGALTRDAGFTMLGNGHFSAAYKHPLLPKRVIKVGFKKEDSGAAYTAFCRMHQGRAGIPNIHHVERHAGCYTVVLDHLIDCDRENKTHDHFADVARWFIESDSHDPSDFLEDDQPLIETCKEIRKFFKGIAAFDMHSGNIMFAEDGTPYITDPVSFSHDRERTEGFPIDPECLLQEIEAQVQAAMIKRCKARKAKCDPNSTFRINRKATMKRRQRNRKKAARVAENDRKHFVEIRMARHQENRDAARGQAYLGSLWGDMWRHNANADVVKIDAKNAIKWKIADNMAIAKGRPLNIDKVLDAQFMG